MVMKDVLFLLSKGIDFIGMMINNFPAIGDRVNYHETYSFFFKIDNRLNELISIVWIEPATG